MAGAWTADAVFDSGTYQTTLTDTSTNWPVNVLVDLFVNPKTDQYLQFYVVSNSANSITVWGDASALGTNTAPYAIWDYHLQSEHGRYTRAGWVKDPVTSPCIDAGDPDSPYDNEPYFNGDRINMGAYGNTRQASKSRPPFGTLILFY